jgi:hypothetical protein
MTLVTRNIASAAEALKRGKLVAFPTETVYGLGANALDETAVARADGPGMAPGAGDGGRSGGRGRGEGGDGFEAR